MERRDASRTAEFMALFRALESSRRPPSARLFVDPFARDFLGPALKAVLRCARLPVVGAVAPWFIDRRWPGARSSGVARTRLIDDALAAALRDGVDLLVILGAGFDCRAYRVPGIERSRVFEIDHPATQAVKRARLHRMLGRRPEHVVFVGVDFNRQGLGQAMIAAGFDPAARSFVLWEGVTNYLTPDAVDSTLRDLSALAAPRSRILFTYVHRGVLDGTAEFAGTRRLMSTLRRAGEPWTFGITPGDLPGYLAARGFELVEDVGAAEYRARYMGPTARRMTGYEFYRVALARARGSACHVDGPPGP